MSTKTSKNSTTSTSNATKSSKQKSTNSDINPPKVKDEEKEVFISLNDTDFDWSRIVISEPTTKIIAKQGGGGSISNTTARAYILSSTGKELPVYFQGAPQMTWGINGSWDMNVPRTQQTLENMKGFQINYPLTSNETMKNPTPAEIQTKKCFDECHKAAVAAVIKECKKPENDPKNQDNKTRTVPLVTVKSFKGSSDDDFMKPAYNWQKSTDKQTQSRDIDMKKPKSTYIKLASSAGQSGAPPKCQAEIYGPGDKLVSPFKYMKIKETDKTIVTEVEPVIHFEGIYYGQHGDSGCGASAKFRIVQMNIKPIAFQSSLPSRKLLSSNTATELDLSDDDDNGVGSQFISPHVKSSEPTKVNEADLDDDAKDDDDGEMSGADTGDVEPEPEPPVETKIKVKSSKHKDALIEKRKKTHS